MVSPPAPAPLPPPAEDRGGPCPISVEISSGDVSQFLPDQTQRLESQDAHTSALGVEPKESGVSKIEPTIIFEVDAANTVQKVYRGHRTRRHLADCAVMNKEIAWWNVLDGALLRQRSETFFNYEHKDTAASRWSRLQKKAAKVGKGLSKDEKARKLAIQHWLEAIDPRHRYGHNLHYYYDAWEKSLTKEPFFYWLDVGEGKEVDLLTCKRSKLQKQQIRYLGPVEREQYEVVVDEGKLRYKKSGDLVNTPKGDKWIFVMSASRRLYIAQKDKGSFQHSSFLAGGATKAAGRLLVSNGTLELMEAHSGHYRPTGENFEDLMRVLEDLGADLRIAKVQNVSDDMLLLTNENYLKSPIMPNIEMYEIDVTTKEYKPESQNLREGQINKSEITQQAHSVIKLKKGSGADEEKEKPTEQFSNDVSQDPQNLLPTSNGVQDQLVLMNIESHVKVEIKSTGILDKITVSDNPPEIISSLCEALDEEESAQMVVSTTSRN